MRQRVSVLRRVPGTDSVLSRMCYWHLYNNSNSNNNNDNTNIIWGNLAPTEAGRRLGKGPWGTEGEIVPSPGNSDDQAQSSLLVGLPKVRGTVPWAQDIRRHPGPQSTDPNRACPGLPPAGPRLHRGRRQTLLARAALQSPWGCGTEPGFDLGSPGDQVRDIGQVPSSARASGVSPAGWGWTAENQQRNG